MVYVFNLILYRLYIDQILYSPFFLISYNEVRRVNAISKIKGTKSLDAKNHFSSLFEQHDRFNFEVKMNYRLNKEETINKYRLSIYFFIPAALHINPHSYPKEKFFADKTNYIRFKTPRIAVRSIINKSNKLSPFFRINQALDSFDEGNSLESMEHDIIYEIRLLGAILKSSLREQADFFISNYSESRMCDDVIINLKDFIKEIEELESMFKATGSRLCTNQMDEIRTSFSFCYQYVSLQIQDQFTRILKILKNNNGCADLYEKIEQLIIKQVDIRKSLDSKLIRNINTKNEEYIYWEGLLKKFTQRVLYLHLKDKDLTTRWTELLFSIAAGFAMFISLMLGLWVANLFTQNTTPYILAIVVAYIFKDRIKDNLKNFSKKAMGFVFPDKTYEIQDSISDEIIGKIRETVKYLDWEFLRPEIYKIRMSSAKHDIEHEGEPEVIIRYSKEVKLNPKNIIKRHQRNLDLHDIMRFNVRNFIQYADDTYRFEDWYNRETGKVERLECVKVYHLNLVLRMEYIDEKGNEITTYKKVRVVLTQDGIRSMIEPEFNL